MLHVAQTLAPIVALVLLGVMLVRHGFFDAGQTRAMNRLVYFVALPSLLVRNVARADLGDFAALEITLALLVGVAGVLLIGWIAAWRMRLQPMTRATLLQAGFRSNLVFVGLPILLYAKADADIPNLETLAVIALAPMIPLYNLIAVPLFSVAHPETDPRLVRRTLLRILTNPLVIAVVVGLVFCLAPVNLPRVADRTLGLLGGMALPLALIGIGGTLAATPLRGVRAAVVVACALKLLLCPALTWGAAHLLGLPEPMTAIAVILSACPAAVSSYVLAHEMQGDEALAAGAVVLGTVASLPVFCLLLLRFA